MRKEQKKSCLQSSAGHRKLEDVSESWNCERPRKMVEVDSKVTGGDLVQEHG